MSDNQQQLPPHSIDAEECVIASLIIDPDAVHQISDRLRPCDFYIAKHGQAYEAICEMAADGRRTDAVTLASTLSPRAGRPESEILDDIVGMINRTPSALGVRHYAEIIEEKAMRRRLIQQAANIAKLAWDETGNIGEQIDQAETAVFEVRGERERTGVLKPRSLARQYLEYLERLREGERRVGLPTGFTDLDRLLFGLQPPYQYILAARPGMGKSALAVDISVNLALKHGKRIAFFAAEMSRFQIMNRLISGRAGIRNSKMRQPWELNDGEMAQVYETVGRFSDSRLFVDDSENISPAEVRAKCMRLYAEHGLDLVIIDHLHIMRPDRNLNRQDQEYAEMTKGLAGLGKRLNVPVLTLAQLNRSVESRQNKRPQLSDLRESGGIEENAFAVMFLYRDAYYDEMTERPNVAEVIVGKHRDGPTGTAELYWNERLTSFSNLAAERVTF